MKCENKACQVELGRHKWVVGELVYCSPWCQRNYGKHPNTAGMYKNVWTAVQRDKRSA